MYAKGFVSGIQFEALFEDDLFFEIARKQNKLAKVLTNGLKEMKVDFFVESPTNQVFCSFKREEAKRIMEYIDCEIFLEKEDKIVLRFVVSYVTTKEGIGEALRIIKESLV